MKFDSLKYRKKWRKYGKNERDKKIGKRIADFSQVNSCHVTPYYVEVKLRPP